MDYTNEGISASPTGIVGHCWRCGRSHDLSLTACPGPSWTITSTGSSTGPQKTCPTCGGLGLVAGD